MCHSDFKPLPAGTPAPDFSLPSTPDQKVALSDFQGQPVILAFYPADWSPVCGDELALYQELLPEFQRYGAELIGISVDGPWSHVAFAKDPTCTSPCCPILNRRARSRASMGSTWMTWARAAGRCS